MKQTLATMESSTSYGLHGKDFLPPLRSRLVRQHQFEEKRSPRTVNTSYKAPEGVYVGVFVIVVLSSELKKRRKKGSYIVALQSHGKNCSNKV